MRIIEHFGAVNLFHQLNDEESNQFRDHFEKLSIKAGEYVLKKTILEILCILLKRVW